MDRPAPRYPPIPIRLFAVAFHRPATLSHRADPRARSGAVRGMLALVLAVAGLEPAGVPHGAVDRNADAQQPTPAAPAASRSRADRSTLESHRHGTHRSRGAPTASTSSSRTTRSTSITTRIISSRTCSTPNTTSRKRGWAASGSPAWRCSRIPSASSRNTCSAACSGGRSRAISLSTSSSPPGPLHGYSGQYQDKIPFNSSGVAPAIIPGVGYCVKRYCGEFVLLGTNAALLTIGMTVP